MENRFIVLAIINLICLTVRTIYEMLKRSDAVDPKNRILFAVILLDMLILWASWFIICPLDPWRLAFPEFIRYIALAVLFAGFISAFGALIQLRGVENIEHLVTTGLFSRLRHPMYLGFILWIVGWAIFYGAVASLGIGIAGIVNILFWRHWEEEHLESLYGEEYQKYRGRTWF